MSESVCVYVCLETAYLILSLSSLLWQVKETLFPFSAEREDSFQTWAGGLHLAYRLILLLYILWEMRQIYLIENRKLKLVLYRWLLFFYIVWFTYLPGVVILAAILNPLERARVVGVSLLFFDFLANVAMVLLFCPKWSQVYLQFGSDLNILARVKLRRPGARWIAYDAISDISDPPALI